MSLREKPPDWAVRTRADELALSQGAWWDQSRADALCAFAENVVKPQYVTGEFRLLDWQKRFLSSLVAWRWADDRRRWRFANLHIAKKQGKTLLVSILALYELFCSEDPSAYVAACAASKENAAQVFKELKHTIENTPLNDYCKITDHVKRIVVPELNAEFRCFASQGSRVHGEPCSLVVLDECHSHTDPELYRALRYNTDARANGLCVAISTAGFDLSHWYYGVYTKSKNVLAGTDLDTTWYAEVYEADPESDYEHDETQWHRACPSLGTSFPVEQFRRDLQSARSNVGDWLNFQRLKLNLWVRPDETSWLEVSDYARYARAYTDEELARYECSIGVDLSQVADPSSVSQVFDLGDGTYYVRSWAWVAEKGIELRKKNKGNLTLYDRFVDEGSMTVTEGDMIDSEVIKQHILSLCRDYPVRQVNFDPTGAYVLMHQIEEEGYPVARVPQTNRNFHGPMTEFARAWTAGKVFHNNSGWLKYTLSNVRVEVNRYGEMRPHRGRSVDFIDGAVSTLLAFHSVLTPTERPSISWA